MLEQAQPVEPLAQAGHDLGECVVGLPMRLDIAVEVIDEVRIELALLPKDGLEHRPNGVEHRALQAVGAPDRAVRQDVPLGIEVVELLFVVPVAALQATRVTSAARDRPGRTPRCTRDAPRRVPPRHGSSAGLPTRPAQENSSVISCRPSAPGKRESCRRSAAASTRARPGRSGPRGTPCGRESAL